MSYILSNALGDGPFNTWVPPLPSQSLDFVNDLNDRVQSANAVAKKWSSTNVTVDDAGNLTYSTSFPYDTWTRFVLRWNDFYAREQGWTQRALFTSGAELNNWQAEWDGWQQYLKKIGFSDVSPFAQQDDSAGTIKLVAIAAIALAAAYGLSRLPSFQDMKQLSIQKPSTRGTAKTSQRTA